jgi:hypothetical protein
LDERKFQFICSISFLRIGIALGLEDRISHTLFEFVSFVFENIIHGFTTTECSIKDTIFGF